MITDIEEFFTRGCGRCDRFDTPDCSVRLWDEGLKRLRRICRDVGLDETVKWGCPCYMHAGRNIVILAAFRADFRVSFFNAALMRDPFGLLERQGANTAHPDMMRFTDPAQVADREGQIRAYLREAMSYAQAGITPPKQRREIDLPAELIEALGADPELGAAFRALTPGRQRSYAINLNAAKKPETRISRIIKFRSKILSGKGAAER